MSKTRVQKILKKQKYTPYKTKIIHHLYPGDSERRIAFCNWYLEKTHNNNDFGRFVIWSDECHISSDGMFNRNNIRYWSDENRHVTLARQRQGRYGFNISCFVLGGKFVYHIFNGTLNSQRYLDILNMCLPQLLDNIPLARLRDIYFQQDGAPCHNSDMIRNYLDENFPKQWLGTRGPIHWPPRSPDLSILDYFLWGYIKNIIYARRHESLEELLEDSRGAFEQLRCKPIYLFNSIEALSSRCASCLRHNGQQFE